VNFWVIFAVAFVVGTYLLSRTKAERYLLVFLIRTKHFLKFIDRVASVAPSLWKFLADCAIVFSFSGVGIAYLSRYRKLSRNLNLIFIILGILAIIGLGQSLPVSIIMFLSLILAVIYLDRNSNQNLDFIFGTFIITLIFLRIPTLIVSLFGYSWQLPLWLAVLEGSFGIIPLLIGAFILQSYQILFLGSTQAGIAPAVPSEQRGEIGLTFYGTDIFIPLVYAVIAILVTIIAHESAHGVLTRVYKLKLKSTGIVTLGIIPVGAFIEPDDEEIEKRPSIEKMQIFAAGSFANFLIAIFSVFMFLFASVAMAYIPVGLEGISVVSTQEGYPAHGVLENGTIIYGIDNEAIKNADQFTEEMERVKPGESITLKTNKGEVLLTTTSNPEDPERAYIGIIWTHHNPLMEFILLSLFWIFFINFNISLVNVLPMAPFDGWKMLKEVMLTFDVGDITARRFLRGVLAVTLLLLLVNALPLFSNAFNSVLEVLL